MAGRNGDESGRWRELGIRLKQRRALLDPRWRNRRAFAQDNHLDYRLIYDIEEARRPNFGVTTLTAIAVAYRLAPDSITAFLGGGELDPAPAAAFQDHDRPLPAVFAALGHIPDKYFEDIDPEYPHDKWEAAVWSDESAFPADWRRIVIAARRRTIDQHRSRQRGGSGLGRT